jgi:hypothetical protein
MFGTWQVSVDTLLDSRDDVLRLAADVRALSRASG